MEKLTPQEAAERAAEVIDRVVISRVRVDGSVAVQWEIADKILAEFAPLLAAKDAEMSELREQLARTTRYFVNVVDGVNKLLSPTGESSPSPSSGPSIDPADTSAAG